MGTASNKVANCHIYQKYDDLNVLEPLIATMVQPQPELRPTAQEACHMFQDVMSDVQGTYLRWRLRSKTESAPERVFFDTLDLAKAGVYHLKRYMPML